MTERSKGLVLGASGMLGHVLLRTFADSEGYEVWGSVRSASARALLPSAVRDRVIAGVDVESTDALVRLFGTLKPAWVVNCVGLVKQLAEAHDPLAAISINALLPHRLTRLCEATGARLVHISTDCVFAGSRGMYVEADAADAQDLYGRSKFLGEVEYPNTVTLRTSIIGPELAGHHGLLGWFLAQSGSVKGFRRAVFSGLSTRELALVIRDRVLPRPALRGVYHVSAQPISKFDLLQLFAHEYGRQIEIVADDRLVIDRSLVSARFRAETGYLPPAWPDMIRGMREFG